MTENKKIGERGRTILQTRCVICKKTLTLSGYFLRDDEGYPLNKRGQRFDYTFPDETAGEGILCDECNNNHRNSILLIKNDKNEWEWCKHE